MYLLEEEEKFSGVSAYKVGQINTPLQGLWSMAVAVAVE